MSKPSDIQCPFCGSDDISALPYQTLWFCYCALCDQEWVD